MNNIKLFVSVIIMLLVMGYFYLEHEERAISNLVMGYFYLGPEERAISNANHVYKAVLIKADNTLQYYPNNKGKLVPLYFDRLDSKLYHRLNYFKKNGYSGLQRSESAIDVKNKIIMQGFPSIQLLFPSVLTPNIPLCDSENINSIGINFEKACPINSMRLDTEDGIKSKLYKQLYAEEPVRDDIKSYQWMAFYTEKQEDNSKINDKWLGWECDLEYIYAQNKKINSSVREDNIWANMPEDIAQKDCHTIEKTERKKQKQKYLKSFTKTTQNPVLWMCNPNNDSCDAVFDFHGTMMRLTVPEPAIYTYKSSFTQKYRHHMLKTAWLWLTKSAILAEKQQKFDSAKALKNEMRLCLESDENLQSILQNHPESKSIILKKREKLGLGVSEYHHNSNHCSRAMHRLIQYNDKPFKGVTDEQMLQYTKQLTKIALQYDSKLDKPLQALFNTYTIKLHGEDSLDAFLTFATQEKMFREPDEVLARYEKLGNSFNQLDAKTRVNIRYKLGFNLNKKMTTSHSRALIWLAMEDWIANKHTMDYVSSVWLMIYGTTLTRSRNIVNNENLPNTKKLVTEMATLAKTIYRDKTLTTKSKNNHIATLSMHISYHASKLAEKDKDLWLNWLENWYSQVESMIDIDVKAHEDVPIALRATKIHIDAIRDGTVLDPECAGSYLSNCSFYPPIN